MRHPGGIEQGPREGANSQAGKRGPGERADNEQRSPERHPRLQPVGDPWRVNEDGQHQPLSRRRGVPRIHGPGSEHRPTEKKDQQRASEGDPEQRDRLGGRAGNASSNPGREVRPRATQRPRWVEKCVPDDEDAPVNERWRGNPEQGETQAGEPAKETEDRQEFQASRHPGVGRHIREPSNVQDQKPGPVDLMGILDCGVKHETPDVLAGAVGQGVADGTTLFRLG